MFARSVSPLLYILGLVVRRFIFPAVYLLFCCRTVFIFLGIFQLENWNSSSSLSRPFISGCSFQTIKRLVFLRTVLVNSLNMFVNYCFVEAKFSLCYFIGFSPVEEKSFPTKKGKSLSSLSQKKASSRCALKLMTIQLLLF